MMDLTEGVLRACALAVTGGTRVPYQGATIDLGAPFRRATMNDLVGGGGVNEPGGLVGVLGSRAPQNGPAVSQAHPPTLCAEC
jgi:hypothetical protein